MLFKTLLIGALTSMTFMTLYSLLHIQKHSKADKRIGIKTDSKLMAAYTLCIGLIALLFFPNAIVGSIAVPSMLDRYKDVISHGEVYYERLYLTLIVVMTVIYFSMSILNLLLLLAYYRLGKKLSRRAKLFVASVLLEESFTDKIDVENS